MSINNYTLLVNNWLGAWSIHSSCIKYWTHPAPSYCLRREIIHKLITSWDPSGLIIQIVVLKYIPDEGPQLGWRPHLPCTVGLSNPRHYTPPEASFSAYCPDTRTGHGLGHDEVRSSLLAPWPLCWEGPWSYQRLGGRRYARGRQVSPCLLWLASSSGRRIPHLL